MRARNCVSGGRRQEKSGVLLVKFGVGVRVLELVAEVFRLHPLNLSIALDDNWQPGFLVSNHRPVDASLECLVLTETCFHLPYRSQRQRFRALLDDLSVQPPPIAHERDFGFEVLDWLIKYADHEPDWADGCLAVLSGRDKDLKVWTYDREFRTTWRRPNGTAIPLAVR